MVFGGVFVVVCFLFDVVVFKLHWNLKEHVKEPQIL